METPLSLHELVGDVLTTSDSDISTSDLDAAAAQVAATMVDSPDMYRYVASGPRGAHQHIAIGN
ncbi:hypothetical protein GCM10023225_15570 [Kineococcus glutinatus]|uniref:Uncharacterized protein n=1 Tax=Kineococcus glutinatus TaxID=1070872 RepID=A0ABP9HPS0_9ACTN